MAFIFADSCDSYNGVIADWVQQGYVIGYNGGLSATTGRWGGGGIQTAVSLPLRPYSWGTLHNRIAFSFKAVNSWNGNSESLLTIAGQEVLGITTGGVLQSYINSTSQAVGTVNVVDTQWHWIEVDFVLNGSSSSGKCYVDNVLQWNWSAAGASPTAGSYAYSFSSVSTAVAILDDLVLWDDSGTTFNNFPLGVQRMSCLNPNAAGDLTEFTPSGGANYACVSGNYSSGTFVFDTGSGDADLYRISQLPIVPQSITAVVLGVYAQNPGTGNRSLTPDLKSNGVTASGASYALLTGANSLTRIPFVADPAGAAWTSATVNALQIGMSD